MDEKRERLTGYTVFIYEVDYNMKKCSFLERGK
jgi:hypothetical protein